MPKAKVLIEVRTVQPQAFEHHAAAALSPLEAERQASRLVEPLSGLGLETLGYPPVPMFDDRVIRADDPARGFAAFAAPFTNPDAPAASVVIQALVDASRIQELRERPGVSVYPSSDLTLFGCCADPSDFGPSAGGLDCRPFRPAVSVFNIRTLLGVRPLWRDGFRGDAVVVGILDEGINGQVYPVTGGFAQPGAQQPGEAPITSHGSMCAADVLVAAPSATLYDYPFLGIPDSGGALAMFQAVLDQRRRDGTPHLTSNSYGFVGVPPRELDPAHEIHDINHPLHRKVREVVASGAPVFFAAGNCGGDCPSGKCRPSGIGPGKSIHASNSLLEVITVAAVNSRRERIGYSSHGPGMFEPQKPDLAAYSHFFGNFGPGRPGGITDQPFDNGTSAATPLASGVGALLLSAFPGLPPEVLKQVLMASAIGIGGEGWNADTGTGVISASRAYGLLLQFLSQ